MVIRLSHLYYCIHLPACILPPLPLPDSVSLPPLSLVAEHAGGVPEESFGSLPEVGPEPRCALFSLSLPHLPQKDAVAALTAAQPKRTQPVCYLNPMSVICVHTICVYCPSINMSSSGRKHTHSSNTEAMLTYSM